MSDDEEVYDDAVSDVPSDEPAEVAEEEADDESDSEFEDEAADLPIEPVFPARADPVTTGANRSVRAIIVPPEEHITSDWLQQSEASYIISMRAQQIERTGTHFASSAPVMQTDAVEIARRELLERRCPLMLRRQVGWTSTGDQIFEEKDPNLMAHPQLPLAVQLSTGSKKTQV
jgi:hypothetical protein